jgi:glycosyltransferase involved in cell wall biosynthesis
LRIVHLLNHCKHGHGNAHVAIDLACRQADLGHSVIYASGGGEYESLLTAHGVQLANIEQSLRHPSSAVKALASISSLVKRAKPDVIHAHMMSGTVLAYFITRLQHVALVTTVHNSFDKHSFLMRLGDRVVAVSQAEKAALVARGFDANRVDVVINGPNGAPRETWLPNASSFALDRPNITTVCGIHQRKGVGDLLTAFAKVLRVSPEWILNIVGDGPDRQKMTNLAHELGVADSVRFLGSAPSASPILQQADIFVLASYADPCSLAVAEALYAGLPVVATGVGGTPELLRNGEAGILVPPGNPDELAAALVRLTTSPEERRKWAERAYSGSRDLVIERVTDEYLEVYRSAQKMRRKGAQLGSNRVGFQ